MRVAVLGGGIAGLVAARRLEAHGADVVLVEPDAPGGKLRTERVGGFVIEAGADSFLSRKERGVGLCEELGLDDELVARRPEHARTYLRRGDDLLPLPEGLTGTIPTNLDALERGPLLSADGLARFREEPDVPVRAGDEDESVGSFVTRRFGREAYEAIVEPLVTGIYGGDGDRMSLEATFPQLRALEIERGSLLRGLATPAPDGRPPFLSLRTGMGALAEAVLAGLERTVVEAATATRVVRTPAGYEVTVAGVSTLAVDGVVVATPAFATAELLDGLDDELAGLHAAIPYSSSVVVTLGYSRADVVPLDGYGYLVPHAEGSDVLACTWSSQKWAERAPDESVLVRVFAGRFGGRNLTEDGDEELVALARDELARFDVAATPVLVRVHRWPLGMPQYLLGHPERVGRIEDMVLRHPGLALAGAAYRGVGIPDCIASGEAAAESVARALSGATA